MQAEVRFTVKGSLEEIPFTVVEGKNEKELYLFSGSKGNALKIPLKSDDGLLRLVEVNPFEEDDPIVEERLAGLSADWLENRSQGFDDNSVDFNKVKSPGYGPDDIYVENKPFSLRQFVELIKDGDIELTPDFQRNFIWDRTRQSKLIESILLGLPLPSLYLSQYEDGRLTVVDGLQRLTTIKKFMEDELVLTNLEYLTDCNGKKYSELDGFLSPLRLRRFGQTQIMSFVIDYRSPSQLKFDLFRRLNTGGTPLNNQEIRNCLSRPEVQQILRDMVNLEAFRMATGNSVKDSRMNAREAALRFLYFYEQYTPDNPVGDYNGDMENTLDEFIDLLNRRNIEALKEYIGIYTSALENSYYLFGEYSFRKILPQGIGQKRTPVNKLLMMSLSVLLSKFDNLIIRSKIQQNSLIVPLANYIEQESGLFEAITYGTNSKSNIDFSLRKFKKFLDAHIS